MHSHMYMLSHFSIFSDENIWTEREKSEDPYHISHIRTPGRVQKCERPHTYIQKNSLSMAGTKLTVEFVYIGHC